MANREPSEKDAPLNRLIQAVKDMQKESEKGLKEAVSKKSQEGTERGIKERAFKS
ncbi:hypothetical protein VN1165_13180 [Helicobacter pylori]|nr:hypothetical protein VN1165_13180 [Helicobacter pylori]